MLRRMSDTPILEKIQIGGQQSRWKTTAIEKWKGWRYKWRMRVRQINTILATPKKAVQLTDLVEIPWTTCSRYPGRSRVSLLTVSMANSTLYLMLKLDTFSRVRCIRYRCFVKLSRTGSCSLLVTPKQQTKNHNECIHHMMVR